MNNKVSPGIYSAIITSIEDDTNADIDFPYILLKLNILQQTCPINKKFPSFYHTEHLPMFKDSSKWKDPIINSLEKLKSLCLALLPREIVSTIKNTKDVNFHLAGKKIRIKFSGYEYYNTKTGKMNILTEIPKYKYVEMFNVHPSTIQWIETRDFKKYNT